MLVAVWAADLKGASQHSPGASSAATALFVLPQDKGIFCEVRLLQFPPGGEGPCAIYIFPGVPSSHSPYQSLIFLLRLRLCFSQNED